MQKTPQQIAYEFLRDGIVAGELQAGERLKSETIADQLGISRMPVREALRQLDAEGLVTLRPNRGAVVTNLTPNDVLELFEMRAVLEGLAIKQAAKYAMPDDLRSLSDHLERLARMKEDGVRWVDHHDRFHDKLCRLSRRERLCDQISLIRQQILPYTRLYARHSADPEIAGHEHEAILDSVRRGDPEEIERVVRAHILTNGHSIVDVLRKILPTGQAPAAARPRGDEAVQGEKQIVVAAALERASK